MTARLLLGTLTLAAAAAAQSLEVAATVTLTEGPAVDAEGNIYFTETNSHRIFKYSISGQLTVFRENSNAANGLAFDAQGRLIACEGSNATRREPRVTRTDMRTGKIEILADRYQGKLFIAPNDVVIDSKGRIYFTDPAFNKPRPEQVDADGVYRIDPDGKITRILTRPAIERPNGVMISPDDRTLYLVEANREPGGARMIRAYDLQPDGSVANMRVFHNFFPGRSADGMCIDTAGNLHAVGGLNALRGTTETLATKAGVYVFSPQAKLLRFIPAPEDLATNCAFGGKDRKTLFVTSGKTLYRAPVEIPGTDR
jgi:gluconolactonase